MLATLVMFQWVVAVYAGHVEVAHPHPFEPIAMVNESELEGMLCIYRRQRVPIVYNSIRTLGDLQERRGNMQGLGSNIP